jgi:hypothetical protein
MRAPDCTGCKARDYHIASLKEELHALREMYEKETGLNRQDTTELIRHVTGMNRQAVPNQGQQLHSVPRIGNTIASRIRAAERADKKEAEPLIAQRKKAYDDRIAALIRPETEVVTDAVQESGTEQIQESVGQDIHETTG